MTDITPLASSTALREFALEDSLPDPSANDLDKDAFLQLLVAQLRYQDPLNPNDPAEFMATTAQFTVVEKLDELTQQGANTAVISGLSMASSLVGREVTFVGPDDGLATGLVSSAQVSNGQVTLVTDNGIVDLSTVTGIGAATAAGAAAQTPSGPADAGNPTLSSPAKTSAPPPVNAPVSTVAPETAEAKPDIPTLSNVSTSPISIPAPLFSTRPETVAHPPESSAAPSAASNRSSATTTTTTTITETKEPSS